MKNIAAGIACLMMIALGVKGQNAKPEFLKGPTSWEFERFSLPPGFAPGFPYKGVEELRFAPGMFSKDASDYFSYAFVARLDSMASFTQDDLRNYLLVYFKGLCANTAKQRNLSIDTAQITVVTEKNKFETEAYNAQIHLFGVFADGAPVTLNAEISVVSDPKSNRIYLVYIASPQEKTREMWLPLHEIRLGFVAP
jgi:hypothetical protein